MEESMRPTTPDALGTLRAGTIWDAIVIGAGPAGSFAARQLAFAGLRTLLVDAKAFPREKVCGGYLSARALRVLGHAQLALSDSDFPERHVNRLELACGHRRVRLPLPTGQMVDRSTFDARLLESAASAGATVLTETQAIVEPANHKDSRGVTVNRSGRRTTLQARVIVCADGLSRSSFRQLSEFAVSTRRESRVGIGASVPDSTDSYSAGQINMVVSKQGYVGITRFSRHQLIVAAAVAPKLLSRAAPGEIAAAILDGASMVVPPTLVSAHWRGTPPLTGHPRQVAAERVFVIGDAGGYVEPFTGEGMAAALESAAAVVQLVAEASRAWSPSFAECWERLHRQTVRDRQRTCGQLAWILRRPWAVLAAMRACRLVPGVARRLIATTTAPSALCLTSGAITT
jgi:flavin-dependent dehydrogenase